jgi:RimJ/RimL family protein N-acetyltransferase
VIKTKRLLLRQWQPSDFPLFAELCADSEVMKYFPSTLSRAESDDFVARIQGLIAERGWGLWAVEVPGVSDFIGFVGLHVPKDYLPFSPCVEIGWRLAKTDWSKGYVSEAAKAALDYAFTGLQLDEVLSFTSVTNLPSAAVMKRIGMTNTHRNFMHPDIEAGHPLSEHVLYRADRSEWARGD